MWQQASHSLNWAQTASRCGNIGLTQSQKERERGRQRERERERQRERERERETARERERERETAKTETVTTEKTETETTETETDRESGGREERQRERERERERETGWQDMCKTALPTSAYSRYTPGRSAPFSRRTLPGRSAPFSRRMLPGRPKSRSPSCTGRGCSAPHRLKTFPLSRRIGSVLSSTRRTSASPSQSSQFASVLLVLFLTTLVFLSVYQKLPLAV